MLFPQFECFYHFFQFLRIASVTIFEFFIQDKNFFHQGSQIRTKVSTITKDIANNYKIMVLIYSEKRHRTLKKNDLSEARFVFKANSSTKPKLNSQRCTKHSHTQLR